MSDIASPIDLFDVFTEWRIDWFTASAVLVALVGYLRVRLTARRRSLSWPMHRDVVVVVGLLAALWTTCGVLQARAGQLMWVWTSQQLLLLLVVPVLVLSGQPLALVRAARGRRSVVLRTLDSPPVRLLGHPFLGPLLVPVVAALLFFGGVGSWSLRSAPDGWVLHLVLLALGALVAIPLVDRDDDRTSLAVGLALAVGLLELMIDAFPGIVLTFRHQVVMTAFGGTRPTWAGTALGDQHTAGGILWAVAEVLDVPFLVLATVAWLRADAREAARADTALDAAEPGAAGHDAAEHDAAAPTPRQAAPRLERPWWEDDAEFQVRFRR